MIEYLKAKCKNKTGLSEQNLSFYLKKSKNQITQEVKNTDKARQIVSVYKSGWVIFVFTPTVKDNTIIVFISMMQNRLTTLHFV